MTREEWLEGLVGLLVPVFAEGGYSVPKVRVSVGFPSRAARAKHRRRIGECWSPELAADGLHQVFISPMLAADEADHVLVHELVHASVGVGKGHRGAFRRCALAVGLDGRMTATTAGPALRSRLNGLREKLGAYPHAVLSIDPHARRPGSRLVRLTCDCGRVLRASALVISGPPIRCGGCAAPFQTDGEREALRKALQEVTT